MSKMWKSHFQWMPKVRRWHALACGACVGVALLLFAFMPVADEPQANADVEQADTLKIQPQGAGKESVGEILDRELDWAMREDIQGFDKRVSKVTQFFEAAEERVPAFVEALLGWESLWAAARDLVTGETNHKELVADLFAKHVFDPHELDQLLKATVDDFVRHLADVDAQLLVRLQADLRQLGLEPIELSVNDNFLQEELHWAFQDVSVRIMGEVKGTVLREMVSQLLGYLLSGSARQMTTAGAVSGGTVGTDLWSIGFGIVAGFIFDAAVSAAYDEVYDPTGQLRAEVGAALDQMRHLTLKGDQSKPGLASWMVRYHLNHAAGRDEEIRAVFTTSQLPE